MRVLLTGANGYIGMRLLPALLEQGHEVICCVRDKTRFPIVEDRERGILIAEGDFLKPETLEGLPLEIDAAYYLIHSMSNQTGKFSEMEAETAENFKTYINKTSAKRILFLSGIVNDDTLSEHLESRKNVESILKESKAALTVLRAGIIVGSGSASFEIIRDLVEKLPIMIAPKWLNTKCQPIGIRNVIALLKECLEEPKTTGETYDIGGPDILTYREMLLQFAEVRGLKRYIVTVPVLTPRLSSLWLYFVTATSYHLARNLVDSMKVDVIAADNRIRNLIKLEEIPYKKAVALAFQKIEQNLVLSSWKDAVISSSKDLSNIQNFIEVPVHGCFKDEKMRIIDRPVDEILENIWRIGGENGWYYGTFLWKIRGYLDKLFGGIGLRRGRRSPTSIHAGDALDFWRVIIASKEQMRLLLYAEMKLPGEAWLEFRIIQKKGKYQLKQTATFRPRGLFGRLYWYAVWPFHIFVFDGMINKLVSYQSKQSAIA